MKVISTPVAFISLALTWRWSGLKRAEVPGSAPASGASGQGKPLLITGLPSSAARSAASGGKAAAAATAAAAAAARLAALEASLQERDREIAELRACLAGGDARLGPNMSSAAAAAALQHHAAPVDTGLRVSSGAASAASDAPAKHDEAASGSGSGDPFEDMLDAAGRVTVLLQDMASFALESAASHIWQWPADSSSTAALPQIGTTAFTSLLRALYDAAQSAHIELPPEVLTRLSDAQRSMHDASEKLQAWLQGAAGDLAEGFEARLSPELLQHYHGARKAIRDVSDRAAVAASMAATEIAAAAAALQRGSREWMRAFVARHPEHAAGLAGRDPLLVAAAALPAALFAAWRALALARAALSLLRRPLQLLRLVLRVACMPLACCLCQRRRPEPKITGGGGATGASAAAAGLREHPSDSEDVSPASLGKASRGVPARVAPSGLRAARRGGA